MKGHPVFMKWRSPLAVGLCLLLCVLVAIPDARCQPDRTLRLLISDSLPPPYLIRSGVAEGEPTGLAVDVCRKVAERLGYDSVMRQAPPKRLPEMVRAGEADMVCHVSPAWYAYPDDMWFGRRLYSADNVFIAPRDARPICESCTLPAEVATVIGYEYGDRIVQAIEAGRTIRRDVRSEENVFRLIEFGRIEYGIVSEYTFHYFARHRADMAIKGSAVRYNITVGVPRTGPITEAELMIASASIRLPEDIAPEFQPFLGLPLQSR